MELKIGKFEFKFVDHSGVASVAFLFVCLSGATLMMAGALALIESMTSG